MQVTIVRFNQNTRSDNVKCFFDAELDFGEGCRVTLYGMKLVKNRQDELYVAFNQREGKDGKYYNNYYISPALRNQVHETILSKINHK